MSFTVFLGNLPTWVTADDIRGWLSAENLVADAIKVIRNPETQESKGFAFIESPNAEEMNSIIRRFDRAPLEDRLLRANPAQPPKPKSPSSSGRPGGSSGSGFSPGGGHSPSSGFGPTGGRPQGSSSQAPSSQAAASPDVAPSSQPTVAPTGAPVASAAAPVADRPRRGKKSAARRPGGSGPQSAFAEELAKVL